MARPLRIQHVGGWYHLTSRGNERRAIFRVPDDYARFLTLLAEATVRYNWRLHAYVLIPNHYHLLVELGEENLSRAVQWLNTSYGQWFNRRYHRAGHLFQGRFKGILLEQECWAVELSRYIHLNPVRVRALGLDKVGRTRQRVGKSSPSGQIPRRLELLWSYPWSSYRAYAGREAKPSWLTCERVWRSFGRRPQESQKAYSRFVEQGAREGEAPGIWEQVQGQVVLGGKEFVQRMAAAVAGDEVEQGAIKQLRWRPSWERLIQVVEKAKGESWEEFRDRRGDPGRELVFWLARRHGRLKLREIGDRAGGMNYRAVDSALRALDRRLRLDLRLCRSLTQIEKDLLATKNEI